MKQCKTCWKNLPRSSFRTYNRGPKTYMRTDCKTCERKKERDKYDPAKRAKKYRALRGGPEHNLPKDPMGRAPGAIVLTVEARRRRLEYEAEAAMLEQWARDGFTSGRPVTF